MGVWLTTSKHCGSTCRAQMRATRQGHKYQTRPAGLHVVTGRFTCALATALVAVNIGRTSDGRPDWLTSSTVGSCAATSGGSTARSLENDSPRRFACPLVSAMLEALHDCEAQNCNGHMQQHDCAACMPQAVGPGRSESYAAALAHLHKTYQGIARLCAMCKYW